MELTINLPLHFTALPKRAKHRYDVLITDNRVVDVPVVSLEDMPVVFSLRSSGREVRSLDGHAYKKIATNFQYAERLGFFARAFSYAPFMARMSFADDLSHPLPHFSSATPPRGSIRISKSGAGMADEPRSTDCPPTRRQVTFYWANAGR